MADDVRGELLRLLADLSDEAPELRFGQLVANLATLAKGASVEAIWDAEDQELAVAARRLLTRYRQRKAGVA
jgi:hypothetical protein